MEETSPFSTSFPFSGLFTVGVLAIIFSTLTFLRICRSSKPNRSLPPGPTGLPIVGILPFFIPELQYFDKLAAIYGPIYSFYIGSQPTIVVSSPSLAREILRDNDSIFANHWTPAIADEVFYGRSDVLWSPNGPTWRMLRRILVQETLRSSSLDNVSYLRQREVRATIHGLYDQAVAGRAVDFGEEMFTLIISIFTSILWGSGTTLTEVERIAEAKEFRLLARELSDLIGQPNMSDIFPALRRFDLQGLHRKTKVKHAEIDGIFEKIIERKRREEKNEGKDFLDCLLKLSEKGHDNNIPFTNNNVKALLMDMILGGVDTIANTLEIILSEMIANPDSISKLQEELDTVVGKNKIVEESHIPKLHYLSAVIKEGLRLHPPAPLLVPRSPSSSCIIGNYNVPQGSKVLINVWAIQRNPTLWKEPLTFNPERFIKSGEKKSEFSGNDFSYLPFGSGRRICPGIAMGEKILSYSLASLMHCFDWKLMEGTTIEHSMKFGISLKKTKPLIVIPVARLTNYTLYAK